MAMTVKKVKDSALNKVFIHKVADIRGGVSVATSELVNDYLKEGTVIGAPESGICHVVKYAKVQADAADNATKIKIYKGSDFKVGDKVFAVEGGKNYAITGIDKSNSAYDEITVGTTLGVALTADVSYVYQGVSTTGATAGAFLHAPFAVVGTGVKHDNKTNAITDAWVIGVTKGNALPSLIAGKLKGIINY